MAEGDNVHRLANSRRGRFRDGTGCGHREEVVESTISLPLHTVGTWWALTEARKKKNKGENNYIEREQSNFLRHQTFAYHGSLS